MSTQDGRMCGQYFLSLCGAPLFDFHAINVKKKRQTCTRSGDSDFSLVMQRMRGAPARWKFRPLTGLQPHDCCTSFPPSLICSATNCRRNTTFRCRYSAEIHLTHCSVHQCSEGIAHSTYSQYVLPVLTVFTLSTQSTYSQYSQYVLTAFTRSTT